ncbi:hypothetical protein [Acinetobacter equi]|uniref:hypothetical protein n=1 Tax=Acinetobacter equi TaxID=1324350 RepID=UPI000ABECBDE|nr:hypothetical protein [Acinetobacter equi]
MSDFKDFSNKASLQKSNTQTNEQVKEHTPQPNTPSPPKVDQKDKGVQPDHNVPNKK